ncbi:MAG: hypothetical protein LC687_03500, partial [Actinobacteria bacterium]|nr:hypothetical protein [Actinomycetota bacterium]
MKVKQITLAIQPYGASAGVRACNIDLSNDAEMQSPEQVTAAIKGVLGDDLYEDALIGKLHLVFRSSDGDPAEHREDIIAFLSGGLSDASLNFQVKELKLEPHQLRPPFLELHTAGTVFTSQDMFYENFNYVVCDIKSLDPPTQPFALVEVSKHAFSTFVFHVSKADDWDRIVENFIEPKYIVDQRARIFLVAAEGATEEMLERTQVAAAIAIEQG